MWLIALAIAFALFAWWFSTGVILLLVRVRPAVRSLATGVLTVVTGLALIGLVATRDTVTPAGAFAGFTYGLVVWAWLETTFLFGFITGWRRTACPPTTRLSERFFYAVEAIGYHEIAILVAGAVVIALAFDAANQVGSATFLVLWAMRISAKLNVFLGAPHVTEEFLPSHLRYLGTYFSRGPVSWLLPSAVSAATLFLLVLVYSAVEAETPFEAVGLTLVASLLGLAIIEHLFLALPIPDALLWRWAVPNTGADEKSSTIPVRVPDSPHATILRLP